MSGITEALKARLAISATRKPPKGTFEPKPQTYDGKGGSLSISLTLKQLRAWKVAEFRLQQRMEFLNWEENELKPYLERMALEASSTLELPELTLVHEDQTNI